MTGLLIVCTANVCRSPYIERVLQARLDAVVPATHHVASAGTNGIVGARMVDGSAALVLADGGSVDGFAARRLDRTTLEGRRLVLTADRAHRGAVLDIRPDLLRRTFTIHEFARLVRPALAAGVGGPSLWDEFPAICAANRLVTLPADPADDDTEDPMGGDRVAFERMRERLRPALDTVVAFAAAAR